jgi:hypothetical protein
MLFDDVKSVEKFYKEYAHDTDFSIRIRQQFSRLTFVQRESAKEY